MDCIFNKFYGEATHSIAGVAIELRYCRVKNSSLDLLACLAYISSSEHAPPSCNKHAQNIVGANSRIGLWNEKTRGACG